MTVDFGDLFTPDQAALPGPATVRLAQDDLTHAVREVLRVVTPGRIKKTPLSAPRRRVLALAAEEMIRSQSHTALSLTEVCATLGASTRTLQLAFLEQFGVGFLAFQRTVRLHQVRTTIRQYGHLLTLAEIATQHGFWHLGRFSLYYRQLFGCKPSDTLRQIWGARANPIGR